MMRIATKVTMMALVAALLAGTAGAAKITISPNVGGTNIHDIVPGVGPTIWTNNNYYDLQAFVRVKPGATLIIEEGTCIVTTTGATQGSLFVCRGAQLFVNGTEQNPVIFTSTIDMNGDPNAWKLDPGPAVYTGWSALASHPTGKNPKSGKWHYGTSSGIGSNEWGSVAVCGRGLISASHYGGLPVSPAIGGGNNPKVPDGTAQKRMEGVDPPAGEEDLARYGGNNDYDDSGSISYVSLRYGGRVLALADELNGLSLGGIGRETDIDHVEIMNNVDDGIEIWGGTVNLKYVSIWNIGDDSFDLDEGWRGKAQFGLIVQGFSTQASQGSGMGDNCFEHDGAEDSDAQPCTTACIYNFTAIGQPAGAIGGGTGGGDHGTAWRDNCHIQYHNCIWMDLGEELVKLDGTDGDGAQGYGYNGTLTWAQAWTTNVESYWTAPLPPNSISQASQEAVYKDWSQVAGTKLCSIQDSLFYNNMFKKNGASADALKVYCKPTLNALKVYRDDADSATAATVQIKNNPPMQLILDTTGGSGLDYTIDLTAAANDTLQELVNVINAKPNWHASLQGTAGHASSLLEIKAAQACLTAANEKTLKYGKATLTVTKGATTQMTLKEDTDGDGAYDINVTWDLTTTPPITQDEVGEVHTNINTNAGTPVLGSANWVSNLFAAYTADCDGLKAQAESNCLGSTSAVTLKLDRGNITAYTEAFLRGVLASDWDPAAFPPLPGTANGNVVVTVQPVKDIQRYVAGGGITWGTNVMLPVTKLDPRAAGDAVGVYCTPPDDSGQKGGRFWTQVSYRGGFSDDTNWLLGWTASDAYGMHAGYAANPTEPTATVELKASVLTFTTQAGVQYVIEESADGHEWTQWAIVPAGGGGMQNVSDFGTPSAAKLYRVRPL